MKIKLVEKSTEKLIESILINNLTWKEFKVVAQIIESPGLEYHF